MAPVAHQIIVSLSRTTQDSRKVQSSGFAIVSQLSQGQPACNTRGENLMQIQASLHGFREEQSSFSGTTTTTVFQRSIPQRNHPQGNCYSGSSASSSHEIIQQKPFFARHLIQTLTLASLGDLRVYLENIVKAAANLRGGQLGYFLAVSWSLGSAQLSVSCCVC